jgi:hypothetical protein
MSLPMSPAMSAEEAFQIAYAMFDDYWKSKPAHLQEDRVLRAVAAEAYLAASGFELDGRRRLAHLPAPARNPRVADPPVRRTPQTSEQH